MSRCLGDLSFEEIDGRRPHHVPAATTRLAEFDLLSPDGVREILNSGSLRAPFFRLVTGGTHLARTGFTRSITVSSSKAEGIAEAGRIWEAMREQSATLVLESLHRTVPGIGALCASLAVELGHPVQANAYVTPPDGQGFAPHVDTHDVFVVQTSGRKHWEVRERSTVLPLPVPKDRGRLSDPTVAAGAVTLTPLMEPGDCLYIPRGFPHSARAQDEAMSIHVTIGLLRPTARDVASDVLAAQDGDEFRTTTTLHAAAADVDRFLKTFADRVTSRAVRAALAVRLVRSLPSVAVPSLSYTDADVHVTGNLRLGAVAALLDEATHIVVLPDRDIDVPQEHWALVSRLLCDAVDGRLHGDELTGDPREVVTELVRQGVLVGG